MSKKNWIMIKRGLSQDAKHREQIGQAIWCFMHIIDRADWETGTVFDWKDQDEADDMGVNVRTLREWRRSLDENNYITCHQEQYGQRIVIHNWTNPRNYSGEVLNQFPQGDIITEPQDYIQDTPQGYTQGNRKDVTPTSNSLIKSHVSLEKVTRSANKTVDFILENERIAQEKDASGASWPHRDKFPDAIRELLDVYVRLTGQRLTKDKVMDWLSTGQDWLDLGIIADDLIKAHKKSKGDERGFGAFTVGRPGGLTNTANMFAGERRTNGKAIGGTPLERAMADLERTYHGDNVPA